MGFGFQTSFGDITGALGDIFGKKESSSETTDTTEVEDIIKSGVKTKQLDISKEGMDKIVADMLGSEQGLASIFSKENVAGIYDSSVAAQASGDLMTKVAGELAKLTAKETITDDIVEATTKAGTEEVTSTQETEGLLRDSARTHKKEEKKKIEDVF